MLTNKRIPRWKKLPPWVKWFIRGALLGFIISSLILIIDSAISNSKILESLDLEDTRRDYQSSIFYDISYSRDNIFTVFKFMLYTSLSLGFMFWLLYEAIKAIKKRKYLLYPLIGIFSGIILTILGLIIGRENYIRLIRFIWGLLPEWSFVLKLIIIFLSLLIVFLIITCLIAFLIYRNKDRLKKVILCYKEVKGSLIRFYLRFKNKYQTILSYLKWGIITSFFYTLIGSIRIAQGYIDVIYVYGGIPAIITKIFYKPAPGHWSNEFFMIAVYICMPIVGFLVGIILKLVFSLIKRRWKRKKKIGKV